MRIKAIFWHLFTIILIFIISFGIWNIVNLQLSDNLIVEIPVKINLPKDSHANWVVLEQSLSRIKVKFEGPKNAINELNQKQKELSAIINIRETDLPKDDKDDVNFSHKISDMRFETEAGRITEALKISMIDETEITYRIVRTTVMQIFITNEDIMNTIENAPDERDYELIINNIEPGFVYIKSPAIFKQLTSLNFEKISLANIRGRGIETREYARKLRFINIFGETSLQFFADKELTRRIDNIDVTFGFNYKNITTKVFNNVNVNVILPPWCIENNITTEELPIKRVPRLNLRGRADELQELRETDIELQLIVAESGIDKATLLRIGSVTYISEYRLYINPAAFNLDKSGVSQQTSQIEIVDPEFSLTGISIKLIKFK